MTPKDMKTMHSSSAKCSRSSLEKDRQPVISDSLYTCGMDMGMDTSKDVCRDMCTDMCTDMCMDMY